MVHYDVTWIGGVCDDVVITAVTFNVREWSLLFIGLCQTKLIERVLCDESVRLKRFSPEMRAAYILHRSGVFRHGIRRYPHGANLLSSKVIVRLIRMKCRVFSSGRFFYQKLIVVVIHFV